MRYMTLSKCRKRNKSNLNTIKEGGRFFKVIPRWNIIVRRKERRHSTY